MPLCAVRGAVMLTRSCRSKKCRSIHDARFRGDIYAFSARATNDFGTRVRGTSVVEPVAHVVIEPDAVHVVVQRLLERCAEQRRGRCRSRP